MTDTPSCLRISRNACLPAMYGMARMINCAPRLRHDGRRGNGQVDLRRPIEGQVAARREPEPAVGHDRADAVEVRGGHLSAVAGLEPDLDAVPVAGGAGAAEDAHGGHEPLGEAPLNLGAGGGVAAHVFQTSLAE